MSIFGMVSAMEPAMQSPVRLGIITDLHQDIIHDAPQRLDAFLKTVSTKTHDAILQMGDFAVPSKKNKTVIDAFNAGHPKAFHVIGNHDTDGGHTTQEVLDVWGMKSRYYTKNVNGLTLVVLDANESHAEHKGGYPSHVGKEQLAWLSQELKNAPGPVLVVSHQPLAGPACVDNAAEVQKVLDTASDKILLAINGHTHIDELLRVGKTLYLHVNSASYYWVGPQFAHESYPNAIHKDYPVIKNTCPYQESLYTTLTYDPAQGEIRLEGHKSNWVGKSPSHCGANLTSDTIDGEQIVPEIRPRNIAVAVKA